MTALLPSRTFCKKLAPQFWLAAVLCLGPALHAAAQSVSAVPSPSAQLLNSERIEQQFGSYGITVLESDEKIRVSNLFSTSAGLKICRTFAVVLYPQQIDSAFAAEHRLIVNGGSLGAVFAAHGWNVEKSHLHFGQVAASEKVAGLMDTPVGTQLAVHVYALAVAKDGSRFDYATLVEVHHPDYLRLHDLVAIYGPLPADGPARSSAAILGVAAEKMR